MADHRRRRSPGERSERERRRRSERRAVHDDRRSVYDEPVPEPYPRMRSNNDRTPRHPPPELSSSSDSSSSSYLDISRSYPPNKSGLFTFFTAPSERRRVRKRRSSKGLFRIGNSSSSSVNSDLAYGTGFIRRSKRSVRSRQGKEIDRERYSERERDKLRDRDRYSDRERLDSGIGREGPGSGIGGATTDAEILAVGAGLAKLARDQNKLDLKNARNGRRPEVIAVKDTRDSQYGVSRGLGPSKIPHGSDTFDEDGWESASDDDSDFSVDSRLAYDNNTKNKWKNFFGRKRYTPKSRKASVVDPRLFGPQNSLYGHVDQAVGFGEVSWNSSTDFGQSSTFSLPMPTPVGLSESAGGSQQSLKKVEPIPTSDSTYYDAGRGSVMSQQYGSNSTRPGPAPVQYAPSQYNPGPASGRFEDVGNSTFSGVEPYISRHPDPIPLQQPQPIPPRSQAILEPSYSARVEPSPMSILKKTTPSTGRGSSLAQNALVGLGGVAAGAIIASALDDSKDRRREEELERAEKERLRRREEELEQLERERLRRRDGDKKDIKDDRRSEKRSSPERDDRTKKSREKDRKDESDEKRREKKREKRREDTRDEKDDKRERRRDETREEKEERRERRREERRSERLDYDSRVSQSEVPTSSATAVDPFVYQVRDDAFPTPTVPSIDGHRRVDSVPAIITVARSPDFTRTRSSSIKDQSSAYQPPSDYFPSDYRDEKSEDRDERDRPLHKAEEFYHEAKESTAPYEAAIMTSAIAAVVTAEEERKTRAEKRRNERRHEGTSEYDDYSSKPRDREPVKEKERDRVQEEADRAYREIVMARKIASQVIRQRTPSPNRPVVKKYEGDEEEPIIRIVTPPEMADHDRKKKGPYDAPNADFRPDYEFHDPREVHAFSIPEVSMVRSLPQGTLPKHDPDANEPRPLLNLVRPTPTPSPVPEKQAARSEASPRRTWSRSRDREEAKRAYASETGVGTEREPQTQTAVSDTVIGPKGTVVVSPVASTVSKAVTWGENETKHYEVESPSDHREEFISNVDVPTREIPEEIKQGSSSKTRGWGAIAAGIMGAGIGAVAASSSDTSKTSNAKKEEKPPESAYEYRGVIVEPEPDSPPRSQRKTSPPREQRQESLPSPGPKPTISQPSHIPGAFDDDIDLTAYVAAGLEDSGFDPDIVINDPAFRRRDSPPGSNEIPAYRSPFAETVSDLGTIPSEISGARSMPSGFILGELAETPQDWRSVSPPREEKTPTKLSKKEQRKRDKARWQSGDITPVDEPSISKNVFEEPDSYFVEPKLSKNEQRKHDKEAERQRRLDQDTTSPFESSVAEQIVAEPESYFETPKKSKKSKNGISSFDDDLDDSSRSRKVSVPVDAFVDVQNGDDDWNTEMKISKKSKRDSDRYDSPSRFAPSSEIAVDLSRSSSLSKRSKRDSDRYESPSRSVASSEVGVEERSSSGKSKRDSERYDSPARSEPASEIGSSKKSKDKSKRRSKSYDVDPTEVSLPPSTPSESSEFDDRRTRKSEGRDSGVFSSADRSEYRSVVSTGASRYEEDEPRKSKKKSRSGMKDDFDDTRSVASAPAGDGYEDSKKSKKKEKEKEKKGSGFFGLFGGSKSESGARDESPKRSKDDFEDAKKRKKSKRSSVPDASSLYGDIGSASVSDLARSMSVSKGKSNGNGTHDYDQYEDGTRSDGEKKKEKSRSRSASTSSKKDSFLGNAGTLGAGVGIAGAAVAIAAQQYQQSKAANTNDSETAEGSRSMSLERPSGREEALDPEIRHRNFRPSIDPQYGDLLPLPPSDPATPNLEPLDDLPELPESRPNTPESDRVARERATSAISSFRKTQQDTPTKSPSQSAVPLKFILGNRSTPQSPSAVRSSPIQSPAIPPEPPGFPKFKSRPTSWEGTKEFRPLYLVESHRRGSNVQLTEAEEAALPPSQATSRSSSQHDFAQMDRDLEASYDRSIDPLSIDTALASASPPELLGSQQSTPKAAFHDRDDEDQPLQTPRGPSDDYDLPPQHQKRTPSTRREEMLDLSGEDVATAIGVAGLATAASYLLSSSGHDKDEKDDGLPSIERQPSPVDPMTKERSSYLLKSSPISRKIDEAESSDGIEVSPTRAPKYASSEHDTLHSIDEHEDPDVLAQDIQRERDKALESLSGLSTPFEELTQEASSREVTEQEPSDEFSFTKSKKDKKKDKKKGKGLSRSSTQDDLPTLADASENVQPEMSAPVEVELPDGFVTKSKMDKKKEKRKSKSVSAWDIVEGAPQQQSESMLESSQDLLEDLPDSKGIQQGHVTSVDDFSVAKSKKGKRGKKNKSFSTFDETADSPQQFQEPVRILESGRELPESLPASESAEQVTVELVDDFSAPKSKKDKKSKKKSKSISTWDDTEDVEQSEAPVSDLSQAILEETQFSEAVEPHSLEPVKEFSTSKSKKDKKKGKSIATFEPEPEAQQEVDDDEFHDALDETNIDMPAESISAPDILSEHVQETIPDLPEQIVNTQDEPIEEFSQPKTKNDKKKNKKSKSKSWEPEEDSTPGTPAETLPEPQQDFVQDTPAPLEENFEDFAPAKSIKDKKGKKKAQSMSSFEPEAKNLEADAPKSVPETDDVPVIPDQPADDFSFSKSKKDKKKGRKSKSGPTFEPESQTIDETVLQEPGREIFEEPASISDEVAVSETRTGEKVPDVAIPSTSNKETILPEPVSLNVQQLAAQGTSQNVEDIAQSKDVHDTQSKVVQMLENLHTVEASPPEISENLSRYIHPGDVQEVVQASSTLDDFASTESKKSKKKKRKSGLSWDPKQDAVSVESLSKEIESPSKEETLPEIAPAADKFNITDTKKGKKKKDKSISSFDPIEDSSPVPKPQENDGSHEEFQAPVSKKDKKNPKKSKTLDSLQDQSATTTQKDDSVTVGPENLLLTSETPDSKPTPVGGPGAWPITPATPLTGGEAHESSSKGNFPAAVVLPLAVGAVLLDIDSSKNTSTVDESMPADATTSKTVDVEEHDLPRQGHESETIVPDGFKSGYKDDQLSLARQLQEEFASGSKKSKKDKKKRESVPSTPDRMPSRSRPVEHLIDSHSRARSLTIGPSTQRSTESPAVTERKNVYSEDQLELARQLKAEFDNKKSKKDKKDRKGRSLTQDDDFADQYFEQSLARGLEDTGTPLAEMPQSAPKGDGLATGYQEDQLSLARQLQAEFGKKSKKDKKSRSTSRTPLEQMPADDYFADQSRELEPARSGEPSNAPEANESVPVRDGLAVGYNEDQLELARQLKEEFAAKKSKKDKKDKKRQSFLRNNTEDNLSSDAPTPDESGNVETPSFENFQEDASSSISADPDDEFATVGKKSKKDKKGKNRGSLLRSAMDQDFASDTASKDIDEPVQEQSSQQGLLEEQPNKPPAIQAEDEFAPIKKSKKGKKRESIREPKIEDLPTSDPGPADNEDSQDISKDSHEIVPEPEDHFAPSKKSKKDKKGKKRDSLIQASTEELSPSDAVPEIAAGLMENEQPAQELGESREIVAPESEEDFMHFTKKSKKDKKGKKRDSLMPEPEADNFSSEPSTAQADRTEIPSKSSSQTTAPAPTIDESFVPLTEEPQEYDSKQAGIYETPSAEPEHDFATYTKKSKRERKGKKRDSVVSDISYETLSKQEEIPRDLSRSAPAEIEPQQPAESAEDDFGYVGKKPKKDKKKRQSIIVQEESTSQLESDSTPAPIPTTKELSTHDIMALSSATEAFDVVEPQDDFGFSKKSQKDKKKRESLLQSSTADETSEQPGEESRIQPESQEQIVENAAEIDPSVRKNFQQAEPSEDLPKELEQPSSVQLEPIVDAIIAKETQPVVLDNQESTPQPLKKDISQEPTSLDQQASKETPENPDDLPSEYGFTKKSKKDKKKKKDSTKTYSPEASGYSTPMDQISEPVTVPLLFESAAEKNITEEPLQAIPEQVAMVQDDLAKPTAAEWSSLSRKSSLKSKSKSRKTSRVAFEEPSGTSTRLESVSGPTIPTFSTEPTAIEQSLEREIDISKDAVVQEESVDEQLDELVTVKNSKEKREGLKADIEDSLSTSLEQMSQPTESSVPTLSTESTAIEQPPERNINVSEPSTMQEVLEEPMDEWEPMKKSRKDKKKRTDTSKADMDETSEPVLEPIVATTSETIRTEDVGEMHLVDSSQAKDTDELLQEPLAIEQPQEDFSSLSRKNSKKDKKKRNTSVKADEPSEPASEPAAAAISEPLPTEALDKDWAESSQAKNLDQSVQESPALEQPQEVITSLSRKNSKKDKKNKKRSARSDFEETLEHPVPLEQASQPLEEVIDTLPVEEPTEKDVLNQNPDAAKDVPFEVFDQPLEEWAIAKIAKEDKKNKKSSGKSGFKETFESFVPLEQASETLGEAVHTSLSAEEPIEKEPLEPSFDPTSNAPVVDEPLEDWAATKKSKKDKKRREDSVKTELEELSGSSTLLEAVEPKEIVSALNAPESVPQENITVQQDTPRDDLPTTISQDIAEEPEPEDEWGSASTKKSKKHKKKRKSGVSTPIEDLVPAVVLPLATRALLTSAVSEPSNNDTESEVSERREIHAEVEDEWGSISTKKSKDKKKQQSGFSTPLEEVSELPQESLDGLDHSSQPAEVIPEALEKSEDFSSQKVEADVLRMSENVDKPEDEWAVPGKKSKNDKKKRKSGLSTPIREPLPEAQQPVFEDTPRPSSSTTKALEENTILEELPTLDPVPGMTANEIVNELEDGWAPTKKSKKEKKKRRSGISTPLEESPPEIRQTALEELPQPESSSTKAFEEITSFEEPTLLNSVTDTPSREIVNEAEEEWAPRKKSKKDKKRKSGISTPLEGPYPETQQPVAEELPESSSTTKALEQTTLEEASASNPVTETPVQEIVGEPEDDWSLTKKKLKSGMSTPLGESLPEFQRLVSEETPEASPSTALEETTSYEESLAQNPVVDMSAKDIIEDGKAEWAQTKKSKKDKKKSKSGISTPAEEIIEPEIAAIDGAKPSLPSEPQSGAPEEFQDHLDQGLPEAVSKDVVDEQEEWAPNKKSKKDKKKRKSVIAIPAEELPESETIVLDDNKQSSSFESPLETPGEASRDITEPIRVQDTVPTSNSREITDEPNDEWNGAFTSKKSKKDKKKRKSGLSTPIEEAQSTECNTFSEESSKTLSYTGPIDLFHANTTSSRAADDELPIHGEAVVEDARVSEDNSQDSTVQGTQFLDIPSEEAKDEDAAEDPFAFVTKRSKKDKKGKRATKIDSESGPSTSTPTRVSLPTEKTERIPVPLPDLEPSNEPAILPETTNIHQNTETPSIPIPLELSEPFTISRNSSKKDKRKRQPTIDSTNTASGFSARPLTSWADDIDEAQVERNVPVIEEIAKDESLSHITPSTPADDYSRPTKKVKKGKRRDSLKSERAPVDDSSRPHIEPDGPSKDPEDKQSDAPIIAAAGVAAIAGAVLLSKASDTGTSSNSATPSRKLSKNDKKKMSIDKRTPRENMFDDPALWEGAHAMVYEETKEGQGDEGSDGVRSIRQDEAEEPVIAHEPFESREEPVAIQEVVEQQEAIPQPHAYEASSSIDTHVKTARAVSSPTISGPDTHASTEQATEKKQPEIVQEAYSHSVESSSSDAPGFEQSEDVQKEFVVSASKEKKEKKGESIKQTEHVPNILPLTSIEPSTEFSGGPPTNRGISFEEPLPINQKHISVSPTDLEQQPRIQKRALSPELGRICPTIPRSSTPRGSRYGNPRLSDLPIVLEENLGQVEAEHHPIHHGHNTEEANRDSAFVSDSPIPPQRGFAGHHEHVRDSGVHLRDNSPAEKFRAPPVSSTDDAIARLSWPSVDEETETVDLNRSQRPAVNTPKKHQHEEDQTPEAHDSKQTKGAKVTDFYRSQRPKGEAPVIDQQAKTLDNRDLLPSQRPKEESHTELHRIPTIHGRKLKEDNLVKQRMQKFESPELPKPNFTTQESQRSEIRKIDLRKEDLQRSQTPKLDKYAELKSSPRPIAQKPLGISEIEAGAAIAGASLGFAAARKISQEKRPDSAQGQKTTPSINRLRTPDIKRPESVGSNRSGTPPLRRTSRQLSGDLRSLSQRSKPDLAKEAELAAISTSAVNTANPIANEGRARAKDMADVYDGFGEGRMGSPRSPTRPHSMRRRQSMQVLDLESKVEQLVAENRMLAEAKAQAERTLMSSQHASSSLVEKEAEIDSLKRTLDWLQNEVQRLTEVNEGLTSANATIVRQHADRYGMLETQHAAASRELQETRDAHNNLAAGMEGIVKNEVLNAVQEKDREIAQLRSDLDAAKEKIREMQGQILASKANDVDFLTIRDEDYFDNACQQLCQHVQQWVLRFSKFSDMRACRLTSEINNDKTIDRLDNAILDGSDVDSYLADRVKRRDVFMSMTMTMIWEFVFTRYLFGMDREQRQKLKSLEKTLSEVGPQAAVHQWRATTLTLLAKRKAFTQQRDQDTQAVVHAILETLSEILPPPSHLEQQIENQLTRVMKAAVDLSVEMRTQRAEYMMLPPLQPEYDANGDLASKVSFNSALMNERSGDTVSNEELEAKKAVVRIVLFPLVVKKGDDRGEGDEEIVVCPAQVLVAKPKKTARFMDGNNSRVSMQSSMPADYGDHGEDSVI